MSGDSGSGKISEIYSVQSTQLESRIRYVISLFNTLSFKMSLLKEHLKFKIICCHVCVLNIGKI